MFVVQFLMGLSIVVAASRQAWAFSRDGALPLSSFLRVISQRMGYIPLRAIWACVIMAIILGLLSLIAPAAAQALFSLAAAGNNLAWGVPIFARLVWGQHKFTPGPFYTGKFSIPLGWTAVVFLIFGIVIACFPVGGPDPTPQSMNYTVVINCAVWLGALAYYFVGKLIYPIILDHSNTVDQMLENGSQDLESHLMLKFLQMSKLKLCRKKVSRLRERPLRAVERRYREDEASKHNMSGFKSHPYQNY